jgi:hypothetical protein
MVWKYDFKKHFQDFEHSPPISNAFTLAKQKLPPEKVLPLAVKRVFVTVMISIFEEDTKWNYINWNFETKWNTNWKFEFENGGTIFCFGPNTFSPFSIKRQKRRNLRGLKILPLWKIMDMSESLYQFEVYE